MSQIRVILSSLKRLLSLFHIHCRQISFLRGMAPSYQEGRMLILSYRHDLREIILMYAQSSDYSS